MYARDYFRKIGAAIVKRAAISVNDDDRAAVDPERRITPSANPPYGLQHGENHRRFGGARFERQPWRECGVTGRITPTGVVGGFVHRQGCRNPYSKILVSVKGGYRILEQDLRVHSVDVIASHLPDGQISESAVQSHLQKYLSSPLTQIKSISLIVPAHRGAFRDRHGRWAWDAMDAAGAADESAGLRTAKSCGPDASTPASSLRRKLGRRR
jgi:hypothetical protein